MKKLEKPALLGRTYSPRERFLCAIAGGQPDRVPVFDFLFSPTIFEEFIGRRPTSYDGADAVDCSRAMGLDAVWVPLARPSGFRPRHLSDDVYVDEWGITRQQDPAAWPIDAPISFPIHCRSDFTTYRAPDPTAPGRLDHVETAVRMSDFELAVLAGVNGPLTTAWLLMGPELLLTSVYDDPPLLRDVFRLSNDFYVEAARRIAAAGADVIVVSEDLGHSSGPFFGLRHYRELLRPYLDELVGEIVRLGKPVLLHSCGQITIFLDDLVESGISALNPLQRTAGMSLAEVKARHGSRLCLVGNVDSSVTLPHGTAEDVEKEVRLACEVAAPGGGYVLASDHSLHDGIPMNNVRRMLDAARRFGNYRVKAHP